MFRNILRSEMIKFFSYNWCFFGVLGTILIAPLVLLFSGTGMGHSLATKEVLSASLRNLFLSQAGLVIVAASFFGQEYSHSYLRTTLLTIPSRMKLIVSKLILLTIIIWIIGLISSIGCLVIGIIQYNSILTLPIVIDFMTKVAMAMLSWTLIAWITASLTIITKSQILPIAVMFSLILGLSQLLFAVSKIAKYLPDLATMNLFFTTNVATLLSGYQGLLVQLVWTLLLCSIAFGLIQYRDVR